jgi:Branched-chain amino acid transport system / permease component
MQAVRDNELAAGVVGVDTYRTKVIAFTLCALLGGLGGGLLAGGFTYISPDQFSFAESVVFLTMALLGGVRSPFGATQRSLPKIRPDRQRSLLDDLSFRILHRFQSKHFSQLFQRNALRSRFGSPSIAMWTSRKPHPPKPGSVFPRLSPKRLSLPS